MDDWLHMRQRWVLITLASKEREQAVLPIQTTYNGDLRVPLYENRRMAQLAAESCEQDVTPIPCVPAAPLEE